MRLVLIALTCVSLGLLAWIVQGQDVVPVPVPTNEDPVQRFVPDQERWVPTEPQRKVVYAEKLILRGPNCEITMDATGRYPGITVQSVKTGERCILYLTPEGNAVVGVTVPNRKELTAGIFGHRKAGYLQLADPIGTGVHVLDGRELSPGFGSLEK